MPDIALPAAIDSHTLLVAAVIVHDRETGRVLLLQRAEGAKFAALQWDLPVGKAEKGEVVAAAAIRELREETGLSVDRADLKLAGIVHGAWGVEAPNGFLTVVLATHRWVGEAVNAEPHKHAQVAWFPVGEVPEKFVLGVRAAIVGYLDSGEVFLADNF